MDLSVFRSFCDSFDLVSGFDWMLCGVSHVLSTTGAKDYWNVVYWPQTGGEVPPPTIERAKYLASQYQEWYDMGLLRFEGFSFKLNRIYIIERERGPGVVESGWYLWFTCRDDRHQESHDVIEDGMKHCFRAFRRLFEVFGM